MPLTSRLVEKQDHDFFSELIVGSPEWEKEECGVGDLESYLLSYGMYNGEWRVWSLDEQIVGISFLLEWSPANEKPWIGTLLVHPNKRLLGIGKKIIQSIGQDLNRKGHKALFAGCPIHQQSWLKFIGKCGFEQFKVETDPDTAKEYMITVIPL